MFKYFVSYSHGNDKNFGFGNAEVERKSKIKNFQDIKEVEEAIKKDKEGEIENIIILNYKLFK